MNEPVLNEWTNSISIALLERKVYKASYLLQPFFTTNDPKISTPQYVNGSSIMHPIFWQTWYLFFLFKLSSQLFTSGTFPNTDSTNELHLIIQKPEDLIWLIVIPQPVFATLTWHYRMINLVVFQDFSNKDAEFHLVCHIFQFFPLPSICHLGPRMDLILIS